MADLYVGIDPGGNGAITVIDNKTSEFRFYEMPKIGKFIDLHELNKAIRSFATLQDLCNVSIHVVLEDVHAIYGSAAGATFSFGYSVGVIEMALVAHNLSYTKVPPKKWQKEMWAGIPMQKKISSTGKTFVTDTKLMSRMAAHRLFPKIDFRRNERCKVDDDNKIDSILLAEYCRRNF